jgi:hypothetical protein
MQGCELSRCHGVERSIWALMVIFIKPLIDYASGLGNGIVRLLGKYGQTLGCGAGREVLISMIRRLPSDPLYLAWLST